ncbi:MAG: radical SAM protein [Thermodesulfobacteriota bacterium]|nr:radical SAM protein [Thermodesulfobacteriota bacterium]
MEKKRQKRASGSGNRHTAPRLVVSDGQGRVFEIPDLEMAGRQRDILKRPAKPELIPLPHGSSLFELPGRVPVGYDPIQKRFVPVTHYEGEPVIAVAAFMAPAYSQLLLAACRVENRATKLPLFAYTAVGWHAGRFVVAACRVDADIRQDLFQMDDRVIEAGAVRTLKRYPDNRLVEHLVQNCVRRYHCPAAQNFVQNRWECPVPTSISCNARCLGCISWQPKTSGVPVTQDRLSFVPTPEEIVEFTVPHLDTAPRPVISFGQGCEGEPLLQGEVIEAAILKIRKRTSAGTINLNSNASLPHVVERLCAAGLDSIRVSLNSAQKALYLAYYAPRGYAFEDVLESMNVMRRHGRWISLNYFIFPGLTDDPEETAALIDLVRRFRVDYIQMRNLNIDPDWYMEKMGLGGLSSRPMGIPAWQKKVRRAAAWVRFGYFNPPKEDWQTQGS